MLTDHDPRNISCERRNRNQTVIDLTADEYCLLMRGSPIFLPNLRATRSSSTYLWQGHKRWLWPWIPGR